MKRLLLFASAFLCVASLFAQDMAIGPDAEDVVRKFDPTEYAKFGNFELRNRWSISRNTDGNDEFLKYLPDNSMVTSVELDGVIYVVRSNNGSLLKFDLLTGRYLGELKLTVDGESIGSGIGALFNLTKDNFGHLVFHGYRATVGLANDGTDIGLALYYVEDLETGACKKAGDLMVSLDEYANNYLKGRVDYSSIVGDVTRQEAHAIVMAAGGASTGLQIYRWKCEQGSDEWVGDFADKDGAGNPDVIMLAPVAADGNVTQWQGATVCTMVQDEEYSGSMFYVDGMSNMVGLYDTNGNFVEDGTHHTETSVDEETSAQVVSAVRNFPLSWIVTEPAANGVCEFTIAGTNFVAYANTQHGKAPGGDVKIVKLGDNFEWTEAAGAEMAWPSVPAIGMGMTSDGGRRVSSITTSPVYTDENGKQGIYLILHRNFNGLAVYTISEKGWIDSNGDVEDDATVYATSISLGSITSTMKIGETQQLSATVLPAEATYQTVKWSSSDDNIATISTEGIVTAKSIGTVTITATTIDGTNLSANCDITIETNEVVPDYAFEIDAVESYTNTTIIMPVKMVNNGEIVGFQCDIVLPEGITITTTNNRFDITLAGREADTHEILAQKQSDGSIRVLVYSTNNEAFAGSEGVLFNINLSVGDTVGSYEIIIKDIYLSSLTVEISVPNIVASIDVIEYRKGDANGDGYLSIVDLTTTAQYIMGTVPENFIFSSADVTNDGRISIQDLVSIVSLIMNEGTSVSASSIDIKRIKNTSKTVSENTSTTSIEIEDMEINVGEEKTITVNLNNSISLIGGQFDITLPDGLNFVTKSNGRVDAQLDTGRFFDHSLNTNILPNGDMRVLIYSNYNTPVDNTTGSIFAFKVKATENAVAGNCMMNVHAIEFSDDALQAVFNDDFEVEVGIISSTGSVNDLHETNLQIKSFVGLVEISGLEIGSNVEVYTPSGMLVKQKIADNTMMQISLTKGVYIIRIDNSYYKVMVK